MGLSAATAERAIDFPPDFGSELTSSQSTAAAENTEVDSADNYAVARLPVCFSSFVATAVRGAGGRVSAGGDDCQQGNSESCRRITI